MGSIKGVTINKGTVGPNASGPDTSPSAFLFNGFALSTLVVNTVYKVTNVKQAEVLGITSAYDITNDVVVYNHITEFFRIHGEGTELFLMLHNATDPATALEDTGGIYAKKLLTEAKGIVRQMMVAYNMTVASTETLVDGLSSAIRAAIPKAQLLAEWAYTNNRPCHILLEGRGISDTLSSVLNLRSIDVSGTILVAPKVSIVIGQDWDYAEARALGLANTKTKKYAAVGTALGTLAAAEVNQSIAEVNVFNLSDALKSKWLTGGLSNHKKVTEVEADLQSLDDKGYIYGLTYNTNAISGYRWNNDHVCCPVVIDENGNYNEHMIYFGRTLDECSRELRDRLLLRLKSRVGVNPQTGKLSVGVRKNLESEGNKGFEKFAKMGLIEEGQTYIDQDSDLITPPKTLLVSFKVVATPILDNIQGTINLVKSIQA